MVALTYRNTDNLQWGAGVNRRLTSLEADQNFYDLSQAILAIVQQSPVEIASVQVVGNQMTFIMDDATTFGPFTLPTATFNFTGSWVGLTQYYANDLFTADSGLYFVRQDHVSSADFNPNASNGQGLLAAFLMPFPTNTSIGFSFAGRIGFGIDADEAMWTYRFDRSVNFPVDLVGSVGGCRNLADADMTMPIFHGDDEIGEIFIAAGTDTVVFTFAAVQQFVANDVIRVIRPAAIDDTARDLSVTLQGRLGEVS